MTPNASGGGLEKQRFQRSEQDRDGGGVPLAPAPQCPYR